MAPNPHLPDWDAPVDFEGVRLYQMLQFRAWTLRQKIQSVENMAELVAHFERIRHRDPQPPDSGSQSY